jgi:hypothetical protein
VTIAEIAEDLRAALMNCIKRDGDVTLLDRCSLTIVEHDFSDEEIVSLWLSVSCLCDHRVPVFVAKHWAEKVTNIDDWMDLLKRHTTMPKNTEVDVLPMEATSLPEHAQANQSSEFHMSLLVTFGGNLPHGKSIQ